MDLRNTFHLLGHTLTFASRAEIALGEADWIELEPTDVIATLQREPCSLGAAWRALEGQYGVQPGPPSESEILRCLHRELLEYTGRLLVARAARAVDGPRCGIGRIKDKHPPKQTVELYGIDRPGSPKRIVLEEHTAAAYRTLARHAREAGFLSPLFLIVSGYRDDARQKELFDKARAKYGSLAEARRWVAPPGHSAHATGCAIDFWFGYPCGREFNDRIKATDAYRWMVVNAKSHGFNPYGREGWHWEYNVGDPF